MLGGRRMANWKKMFGWYRMALNMLKVRSGLHDSHGEAFRTSGFVEVHNCLDGGDGCGGQLGELQKFWT